MKMRVEIPRGSNLKYEKDKETGDLVVDRVLKLKYPSTYGYIENTLAEDGDQVDVFLVDFDLSDNPIPDSIAEIEPIALVEFIDNGEIDNKVIAKYAGTKIDTGQVNKAIAGVKYFLKHYKPEEEVEVGNVLDKEDTLEYINKCKT